MIYLDNAATTYPKPPQVLKAASLAAREYFANPGRGSYPAAEKSGQAVFSARTKAAEYFGADSPEKLVFTPNCTASINYVLKGCLQSGDHVIISELEHNAVVRPLNSLERLGVLTTRARVHEGQPEKTVREFERAIRRNTKMIFCTHASNVLGVALPVRQIGELCRRYGLIFGVDTAQTAGILPTTLGQMNADFICAPAHKGLYGIMGLGALAVGGRHIPDSIIEGGTGSLSAHREQPDFLPDRLESGTLNVPGICAFAEGINAVEYIGIDNIYRHELELMQHLYTELERMPDAVLYTAKPEYGSHAPLISFNIGDMPSDKAGALLGEAGIAVRAGYHCAYDAHIAARTSGRGTVRVCPSMYTTHQEIDALLRAVDAIGRSY